MSSVESLVIVNAPEDVSQVLTSWDHDPEKVHQEVVSPEVVSLGSRVGDAQEVVVEHAGGVVEDISVDLSGRDDDLQWVAQRMVYRDHASDDKTHGTPEGL